ncbi:unnamed protein product [Calypogeia fissa]
MEGPGFRIMTVTMILAVAMTFSFWSPVASIDSCNNFPRLDVGVGLLINFSVPCDLPSAIAVPDKGGLLTPNILAAGYLTYIYDGKKWNLVNQSADLFNHSLAKIGSLIAKSAKAPNAITFELFPSDSTPGGASISAAPVTSVAQPFSIALQLLKTTGAVNSSTYQPSDYVQRFGTLRGLPPASSTNAKAGDSFYSQFAAFYAFYLPINLSPQLATRVPRCGDERFYGLQYGEGFP